MKSELVGKLDDFASCTSPVSLLEGGKRVEELNGRATAVHDTACVCV